MITIKRSFYYDDNRLGCNATRDVAYFEDAEFEAAARCAEIMNAEADDMVSYAAYDKNGVKIMTAAAEADAVTAAELRLEGWCF